MYKKFKESGKRKETPGCIITKRQIKMSTTIITELIMVSTTQPESSSSSTTTTTTIQIQPDVDFVKCECCGLSEECTIAYIERIRERYMGKWICGLCSEAVKDEVVRSERLITTEEAITRHLNVCRKFRAESPPAGGDPTSHLIKAMRSILRRTLDSPRSGLVRSTPTSPNRTGMDRPKLIRSESCFPDL